MNTNIKVCPICGHTMVSVYTTSNFSTDYYFCIHCYKIEYKTVNMKYTVDNKTTATGEYKEEGYDE